MTVLAAFISCVRCRPSGRLCVSSGHCERTPGYIIAVPIKQDYHKRLSNRSAIESGHKMVRLIDWR